MPETAVSASKQNTLAGCAIRFFWMAAGNIALFFLALTLAQNEPFALSWRDAAFVAVILALIGARFADIAYLDGTTTEGERATPSHWRRYAVLLLLGGAGLWLVARGVSWAGWLR